VYNSVATKSLVQIFLKTGIAQHTWVTTVSCCVLCQWMYQSLISYVETVSNSDLTASATPRKTEFVFSFMWDALERGQRAVGIYALSKIKGWTLILLSFPGIWGSARIGSASQNMMFSPRSLIGIFCQADVRALIWCPPLFIKGLLTGVSCSPSYALKIWLHWGTRREIFHILLMETVPVLTQA